MLVGIEAELSSRRSALTFLSLTYTHTHKVAELEIYAAYLMIVAENVFLWTKADLKSNINPRLKTNCCGPYPFNVSDVQVVRYKNSTL